MVDVTQLTTEELAALRDAVAVELGRRWAVEQAPARAAEADAQHRARLDQIARDWHEAHGGIGTPTNPRPWEPPAASHEVWPRESVVTRTSKVWRNTEQANDRTPGTTGSGWTEETT